MARNDGCFDCDSVTWELLSVVLQPRTVPKKLLLEIWGKMTALLID